MPPCSSSIGRCADAGQSPPFMTTASLDRNVMVHRKMGADGTTRKWADLCFLWTKIKDSRVSRCCWGWQGKNGWVWDGVCWLWTKNKPIICLIQFLSWPNSRFCLFRLMCDSRFVYSPLDNGGNLRMSRHFLMTPCCLDIDKIAIVTSNWVAT